MAKSSPLKLGASLLPLAAITLAAANAQAQEERQSRGIETIVVKAEKTEENLQDLSSAVTVVTGDVLVERGILDLQDAQMLIPAARFQREGNNTQVFVRGVGSNLDFGNIEPTISFNYDGVFQPREGNSSAFFDINRIEVLPGPQGTLYGRGAIGGAVNIYFNRPEHNNSGNLLLEAGNYDHARVSFGQNFPITEDLAIRLAGDYTRNNGYFSSGAGKTNNIGGRLSFLYEPTDDLSAYVWLYAAEKNGTSPNLVNHSPTGFLVDDPYDDLASAGVAQQIAAGLPPGALPIDVNLPDARDAAYDVFSVGGEINWDVAGATLTYIPGYTNLNSTPSYWLGVVRALNTQQYRMHSHELRIAAQNGPVEWLAGVFYYRQRNFGIFESYPVPLPVQHSVDIQNNTLEGYGVFGQATVSLSDQLRVIFGGRYAEDEREANGFDPEFILPGSTPSNTWSFARSYTEADWKTAVEYDISDDVMIYASAQTGSGPGTYNSISQAGLDAGDPFVNPGVPYDGEVAVDESSLLAFAGGMKGRFFDNTLQFNPEVFYYIYSDLILQQFNSALLFNTVFNAEEVIIYGVQADLLWLPTDYDELSVSLGYTHARNEKFVTPAGNDFTGLQPPYAPDWTLVAGYTHTFDLGHGNLDASAAVRYESSWFADFVHTPGTQQEASAKVDLNLTYDSGENWQFGLWAKNITDQNAIAATAAAGFPGPATAYLENPRTWGVRLTLSH